MLGGFAESGSVFLRVGHKVKTNGLDVFNVVRGERHLVVQDDVVRQSPVKTASFRWPNRTLPSEIRRQPYVSLNGIAQARSDHRRRPSINANGRFISRWPAKLAHWDVAAALFRWRSSHQRLIERQKIFAHDASAAI